jgi:hypothetical protein
LAAQGATQRLDEGADRQFSREQPELPEALQASSGDRNDMLLHGRFGGE